MRDRGIYCRPVTAARHCLFEDPQEGRELDHSIRPARFSVSNEFLSQPYGVITLAWQYLAILVAVVLAAEATAIVFRKRLKIHM